MFFCLILSFAILRCSACYTSFFKCFVTPNVYIRKPFFRKRGRNAIANTAISNITNDTPKVNKVVFSILTLINAI